MPLYGYMGTLLSVDLTNGRTESFSSAPYTNRFLGGRGLAVKLHWDLVPPDVKPYAAENCLFIVSGPTAGFHGLGGNRWQICATASIGGRNTFSYANLGGKWGAMLKYAGYDGLIVRGQAEKPAYLLITDNSVEMRDASHLWGKSAFAACDLLQAEHGRSAAILTLGPAAENLVAFATLLTDDGASGSGGLGAVMGAKKLKAIVVSGKKRPQAADPSALRELVTGIQKMREIPFAHAKPWDIPGVTTRKNCYGCSLGCSRHSYLYEGKRYKSFCQAAVVYMQSEGDQFGGIGPVQQLATRLCDSYGLDTSVIMGMAAWLTDCYRAGLLTEAGTGLPLSKPGSAEFIESLTKLIAGRQGFGHLLARGTLPAAQELGAEAVSILNYYISTPAGETKDYDPRLIPAAALLYATEPRRPIQQLHELSIIYKMWLKWVRGDEDAFFSSEDFFRVAEIFLGGRAAADFTTYEGKALCAKIIQDRAYAKESLILCDFIWPMKWTYYPGGHVGDPTLEGRIFTAITGKKTESADLLRTGERIFNLQRALVLRQGHRGRNDDRLLDYYFTEPLKEGEIFYTKKCEVMGPDGKPVSKLGTKLERGTIDRLQDEYYELRGWDKASGLPTRRTLSALGLEDIVSDLAGRNLLA